MRVNAHYCMVCHSDLSVTDRSLFAFASTRLGHKDSGIVKRVGYGVSRLTKSDHVLLAPVDNGASRAGGNAMCLDRPPLDQHVEIDPFVLASTTEKK